MTHSERCGREGTRDVIFVFQVRNRQIIKEPDGREYDGEGWSRVFDDDEPEDLDAGYLSFDELYEIDNECIVDTWDTESVWLDREEAETFGECNSHNYGAKNKDWQVYGVPANGQLARILQSQDAQKDTTP
jgi:hypothetical protein